jgi:hypothetical protein
MTRAGGLVVGSPTDANHGAQAQGGEDHVVPFILESIVAMIITVVYEFIDVGPFIIITCIFSTA